MPNHDFTSVSGAVLILSLVALGLSGFVWFTQPSFTAREQSIRTKAYGTSILAAVASSAMYFLFLVLWSFSWLDSRNGLGAFLVVCGFLCSTFAMIAALLATETHRFLIVLSAAISGFLWLLAAAASAAA